MKLDLINRELDGEPFNSITPITAEYLAGLLIKGDFDVVDENWVVVDGELVNYYVKTEHIIKRGTFIELQARYGDGWDTMTPDNPWDHPYYVCAAFATPTPEGDDVLHIPLPIVQGWETSPQDAQCWLIEANSDVPCIAEARKACEAYERAYFEYSEEEEEGEKGNE